MITNANKRSIYGGRDRLGGFDGTHVRVVTGVERSDFLARANREGGSPLGINFLFRGLPGETLSSQVPIAVVLADVMVPDDGSLMVTTTVLSPVDLTGSQPGRPRIE